MIWLVVRRHQHEVAEPREVEMDTPNGVQTVTINDPFLVDAPWPIAILLEQPTEDSLRSYGPGEYAVFEAEGDDELPLGGFPYLVAHYTVEEHPRRDQHPVVTKHRLSRKRSNRPK